MHVSRYHLLMETVPTNAIESCVPSEYSQCRVPSVWTNISYPRLVNPPFATMKLVVESEVMYAKAEIDQWPLAGFNVDEDGMVTFCFDALVKPSEYP